MKQILKIKVQDYLTECGDGCCTDYGTWVWITDEDGEHLFDEGGLGNALISYLGIEIDVLEGDYPDD